MPRGSTAPHAQPAEPTDSRRRRLLVLTVCCLSLFLVCLDTTAVNIALPALRHALHAPAAGLQWTVDAYTLVLAVLLIPAGSVADRLGRRRVFRVGLLVFVLGSLLCSLAPGLGWLIGFRALQAVGGSMLNPVAMSIITNTFTDPRERAQAIGAWGGVVGLAMALGPLIGGFLVSAAGWQWIFLVNVPVGLAVFALTFRHVPESRAPRPRRLDPVGQLLLVLLLGGGTAAIIEGPGQGWHSPVVLLLAALALAALLAFPRWERRTAEPLIDPRFFASVPFTGAVAAAISACAALGGFLFLSTVYLQEVRHLGPVQAGLHTLPMAALMFVGGPVSGWTVGRYGPRPPLLVAGAAICASGLLLVRLSPATPTPQLLLAYALFGLGFGVVNAPITNSAVAGMPSSRAGVAAGVASTSRQVGQSLGVAVIGSVVSAAVSSAAGTDFTAASHTGWWIVTGLGAAVLLLALATTTPWAARTAHRVAARLDPAPVREAPAERLP
ncbi:MFS transporter [Kitasatospora sp. MMS16-BH015]|uniref:MFS transporter n=1 Tax=Kitasatospora sp. MMS16-BH015 TaxID=2018025 RepID=UPI000CA26B55|nr:MFS transporter [Kitasatospora sp. MMS16-BH015]AUG76952.1 MFS transporter [Kitasatospora sp. MMS16-BH015]